MNTNTKTLNVPGALKKLLLAGEQVEAIVKQTRFKALFTPDSIIVTNQRIIRYSPSALGLHKEIEDYRYQDIANIKMNKGVAFGTITIKRRFMSEDLILDNLPKGGVDTIARIVQENLGRMSSPPSPGANQTAVPPENALEVLKLRYARGEISKEQFDEMRKSLE